MPTFSASTWLVIRASSCSNFSIFISVLSIAINENLYLKNALNGINLPKS
ncbi:hypothetical protein PrNR1418_27040 [Providencia rettgeri]|nr:hypothetical protein BML2576_27670 [Providencia rettgeri]BDH19413.1 hypothetical protein PrNR1418_27040 [Providencia rettgeri]